MPIAHDGRTEQTGPCSRENNNSVFLVKHGAAKKAKAIAAMSTTRNRENASTSNRENIESNTAYSRVISRRKLESESSRASSSRDETPSSSIYRDNLGEHVDVNSTNEKRPLRGNGKNILENDRQSRRYEPTTAVNNLKPSNVGREEKRGKSKVNTNSLTITDSLLDEKNLHTLSSPKFTRRTRAFSWKKYNPESVHALLVRDINNGTQINELKSTNASIEKKHRPSGTNGSGKQQTDSRKNIKHEKEKSSLSANAQSVFARSYENSHDSKTNEFAQRPLKSEASISKKIETALKSLDPRHAFRKQLFPETGSSKRKFESIRTPRLSIEKLNSCSMHSSPKAVKPVSSLANGQSCPPKSLDKKRNSNSTKRTNIKCEKSTRPGTIKSKMISVDSNDKSVTTTRDDNGCDIILDTSLTYSARIQNSGCPSQHSRVGKADRAISTAPVLPERQDALELSTDNETVVEAAGSISRKVCESNNYNPCHLKHAPEGTRTPRNTTTVIASTSTNLELRVQENRLDTKLNEISKSKENEENCVSTDQSLSQCGDCQETKNLRGSNEAESIIASISSDKIPVHKYDSHSYCPIKKKQHKKTRKMKNVINCNLKVQVDDFQPRGRTDAKNSSLTSSMSRDSLQDSSNIGNESKSEHSATRDELLNCLNKEIVFKINDYVCKGSICQIQKTGDVDSSCIGKPETSSPKKVSKQIKNYSLESTSEDRHKFGAADKIIPKDNNHSDRAKKANSKARISEHRTRKMDSENGMRSKETRRKAAKTDKKNENCRNNLSPNDAQLTKQKLADFLALSAETHLKYISSCTKRVEQKVNENYDDSQTLNGKKSGIQWQLEFAQPIRGSGTHSRLRPRSSLKKSNDDTNVNDAIANSDGFKLTKNPLVDCASTSAHIARAEIIQNRIIGKLRKLRKELVEVYSYDGGISTPLQIMETTNNTSAEPNDSRSSGPFTKECTRKCREFQPPELCTRQTECSAATLKISPTLNVGFHGSGNSEEKVQPQAFEGNQAADNVCLRTHSRLQERRMLIPSRKYSYRRVDRNRTSDNNQLNCQTIVLTLGRADAHSRCVEKPVTHNTNSNEVFNNNSLQEKCDKIISSPTGSDIQLKIGKKSLNLLEEIKLAPMLAGENIDLDSSYLSRKYNQSKYDRKTRESELAEAATGYYPPFSKLINPVPVPRVKRTNGLTDQRVQCYHVDSPLGDSFVLLEDEFGNFSYVRTANKSGEGVRFDETLTDNLHTEMAPTHDHIPSRCSSNSNTSDSQGSLDKTPFPATSARVNGECSQPQSHGNHQYHPSVVKENPQGGSMKDENSFINEPRVSFTSLTPPTKREKLAQRPGNEGETSRITRSYTSSIESGNGKSQSKVFVNYRKKVTFTDHSEERSADLQRAKEAAVDCGDSKQTSFGIFRCRKPANSESKSHCKKNTFRAFFGRSNKAADLSASEGLNEWPNNYVENAWPTKIEGKEGPVEESAISSAKPTGGERESMESSCKSGRAEIAGGGLKETLWGITQVNVFNDGSKTFELRKPAQKKPRKIPDEIENIFVLPAPVHK